MMRTVAISLAVCSVAAGGGCTYRAAIGGHGRIHGDDTIDRRDDLDRLAGLLPPPLRPVEDGIGVMAQSVAARVRWQAQQAPGRRWIPRSNVGVVTFHGTSDAPVARHSLYTFDLADPASPGRPYVVVDAPLTAGADEVAPAVPTAQESP